MTYVLVKLKVDLVDSRTFVIFTDYAPTTHCHAVTSPLTEDGSLDVILFGIQL